LSFQSDFDDVFYLLYLHLRNLIMNSRSVLFYPINVLFISFRLIRKERDIRLIRSSLSSSSSSSLSESLSCDIRGIASISAYGH